VVLNLAPKRTLHDVFTGRCSLDQALIEVSAGFTVLLAGSGMVEYSRLTPEVRDKLIDTLNSLAPRFEHVLLDTGAGISDVVLYTVSLADEVVVVVTPEPTSMTDAYATIKVIASTQRRRRVRVLVNQRVAGTEAAGVVAQLQRVVERHVNPLLDAPLVLELLGDVPSDPSVRDAVRRRQLLAECFPGAPASQAIAAAAARLSSGT
jgi:flagellar biosynthesis protein FlhG